MTMRDLLPNVYTALRLAAFDISDHIAFIQDIDAGRREYKSEATRQMTRRNMQNKVRQRKEMAKSEVAEELTRAGRPDLIEPFQKFVDRYLSRENAGKLIERLFDEERRYDGPTPRGARNVAGQYIYDLLD